MLDVSGMIELIPLVLRFSSLGSYRMGRRSGNSAGRTGIWRNLLYMVRIVTEYKISIDKK